MMKNINFLPVISLLLSACAPALDKEWDWDNGSGLMDSGDTASEIEGVYSRVVNATDYELWTYLDLETNSFVEVDDPMASSDWDIGMLRYHIKLNSGIHGPAEVQAVIVEGEDYDTYAEVPTDGYQIDLEDENGDGTPEYVFGTWYDYDISTHILTPKNSFYVVKSKNQFHYKFQILSYYSDAGTPANVHINWEILDPVE